MGIANLVITRNWEARNQAEKLGMPMPEAETETTTLLFYNRDVKRSYKGDDGNIILVMNDDTSLEIEYDDKLWKGLEIYFRQNED